MRLLITLLLLLVCSSTYCQRKTYQLRLGYLAEEYDLPNKQKTGKSELIKDIYKFTLEAKIGADYLIWLIPFKNEGSYDELKGSDLNTKLYKNRDLPIYFLIPEDIWGKYVDEVFESRGSTFGIVNVPMKLRFANSNPDHRKRLLELESNVNLGLSFAPYWRNGKEQFFFWTSGVTITQIKVDNINTLGFVTESQNRSGFSLFTGLVYQKENYQIGLLLGSDYTTGDVSEYWVYQKKAWVGLGIGIGIFQPNNKPIERK